MVFPCLSCFEIRHCSCSVRLCFSFHSNFYSVLVWKTENVSLFFLFPVTYYYFLLPATKKHFWCFGPFLVCRMLMDDTYICSRALLVQIAYEGWSCSNQTWLKVIEIEMEKAIRSHSSHTHPRTSTGLFPMVHFWCFPEGVSAGQCSLCIQEPASLPPSWKWGNLNLVKSRLRNV